MFATSMKGIHERFDALERALLVLTEKQQATKTKLEEIAAKVSGKKVICYYHLKNAISE